MTGYAKDAFLGRRALVTAGASGIGAAISKALADAGCEVIVSARGAEDAERWAKEIGGIAATLDVTDDAAVRRVVCEAGPIDILINNAGIDQHAFFTKTTPDEWRMLVDVNLMAVLSCTQAVLPAMQERCYGRIVNIASEAARQGSKGGAVYAAAKGGVISFTKSIARENARFGITANVVLPGPVRTPLLEKAVAKGGEKLRDAMASATLLGRIGEPEEVAAPVLMLASEAASFITGEVLGVSGGMGC
ncbi:3-oxoacyl-[acyl-carrier protein] reductase [Sphingobium indicum BiD32]|uniref:3-oxoacyl-[acyl-carrier protein] reductase n=1 Tax=Sphingobium indicum BiD32 TaxID=1301087 RepID=N1MK81_9SPHN|nr:SDR family oxidoreductase [Sphingobium indicum]CCW15833.1 3-oxoacyl-[acyl-carrier protein] reductase [Sphingobium indicum BiD32]